jgi:hypothetical protein
MDAELGAGTVAQITYSMMHSLSCEKMTIAQPVNKINFCGTQRFITMFTKAHH